MAVESGTREQTVGFAVVGPCVRFSELVTEALRTAREEIDALNVYPVPDGDTGTNLFLTFEAADDALRASLEDQGGEPGPPTLAVAVAAYSRGLLLGARGNSGVIMSPAGRRAVPPHRRGRTRRPRRHRGRPRACGRRPRRGTPRSATRSRAPILTVSRAASEAALATAQDPEHRTAHVFEAASRAAGEALDRTPDQLEVLRRAGVVDAGGRGLCLVLEAAAAAFSGRRELAADVRRPRRPVPRTATVDRPPRSRPAVPTDDLTEDGPAYEVMYLLDAEEDAVARLRDELRPLGDSLVVVGGEGLWNVHVHVDDVGRRDRGRHPRRTAPPGPGDPLRRAGRAGRVARRTVRTARARAARSSWSRWARAWPQVFAEAGASVVTSEVTRRPSAGQLVEAVARHRRGRGGAACPTAATCCRRRRPRPGWSRRRTPSGSRWCRRGRRCRGWPRWRCTSRAARSTRTSSR